MRGLFANRLPKIIRRTILGQERASLPDRPAKVSGQGPIAGASRRGVNRPPSPPTKFCPIAFPVALSARFARSPSNAVDPGHQGFAADFSVSTFAINGSLGTNVKLNLDLFTQNARGGQFR
jgi:hypothetical protein